MITFTKSIQTVLIMPPDTFFYVVAYHQSSHSFFLTYRQNQYITPPVVKLSIHLPYFSNFRNVFHFAYPSWVSYFRKHLQNRIVAPTTPPSVITPSSQQQ